MEKLGIYVHVPFCVQKCHYCDFYSLPGVDAGKRKQYVRALLVQISACAHQLGRRTVDTIFIGGGTPSLLTGEEIAQVLRALREGFAVEPDAEITIECNPATLSPDKLSAYRASGVNRISLGAQSFDDAVLRRLGRVHDSREISRTVEMIRAAGFAQLNLDVMFGVPGQTLPIWQDTVSRLLALRPEHISFYSLELAEGTEFWRLYEAGRLQETAPELDRAMYHDLLSRLRKAGYEQYEISNAALPGCRCRHNLKYWNMEEYLGLGAAAHSFMDGCRWAGPADVDEFLRIWEAPEADAGTEAAARSKQCVPPAGLAREPDEELMSDFVFTALRKNEGLSYRRFAELFHLGFWQRYDHLRPQIRENQKQGLLVDDGQSLCITEQGFDVASRLIAMFL